MIVLFMMISSLLFALVCFCLWCWFQITHRHILRMAKDLPKIQPNYPILGNILLMMRPLESATDFVLKQCAQRVHDGCSALCFWVGPFPLFLVTGADDIKKIMNNSDCLGRGPECESNFKVFTQYGLVMSPGKRNAAYSCGHRRILRYIMLKKTREPNESLSKVLKEVDNWRITRRQLNLLFHPRNLDQMFPQFNANSREVIERLSAEAAGDSAPLDTLPPIIGAAIKTLCQLLFGTEHMSKISFAEFERLRRAVKTIPELLTIRLTRPWLRNDTIFNWYYRKELKEIEIPLVQFAKIARSELKSEPVIDFDSKTSKEMTTNKGYLKGLNILQLLRVKFPSLPENHLEDELVSFYVTGADTVGCGLSSCLLALAQYPHIQRKAYAEISSVMGDQEGDDVTAINLKQMPFLDQLFKETHRFFTITPIVPRMSEKDIQLNECTLPAKATLLLCTGALNLNSKVFSKPEKFDPDRFSPDKIPEDCPFMPYGGGPRNCIGKIYSTILMKVMLVHILRRFELSTSMDINKLRKRYAAIMFSADGYKITLTRRKT